jgi:transcriptional regulator with XRE-family HTH domain
VRTCIRRRLGDPVDDFENLIDQVSTEVKAAAQPLAGAIQRVNYTHDGMINLILANRGISQNQIAAHFGYSASWVSQVMSSDAFQAKLLERASEIEDPTLRATVEESLRGLVTRSMEILKEKLNAPAASVPDNLAIRTLELSTRALGYGARESTVAVQVNVENHLEQLGGRLTTLLTRKKAEIILPIPLEPLETET